MTKSEAVEMFPIGSTVAVNRAGLVGTVTSIDEYVVAFLGRRVVVTVNGLGEYSPTDLVAI